MIKNHIILLPKYIHYFCSIYPTLIILYYLHKQYCAILTLYRLKFIYIKIHWLYLLLIKLYYTN
jgi:hypothetical protein